MKLSLQEIIVLLLASRSPVWVPSYHLSKVTTPWGFIGSSGERRARELAEVGKYELKGMIYFIEKRMNGKFVEYRVAFSEAKKPKFEYVRQPNGAMLEVPAAQNSIF